MRLPVELVPCENVRTTNTHMGRLEIPDLNAPGNSVDLDETERIEEISTNYAETGVTYERKTTNVNIYFAKKIAKVDLDPESKSILECTKHSDWSNWKEAIKSELISLNKRNVYAPPLKEYAQ